MHGKALVLRNKSAIAGGSSSTFAAAPSTCSSHNILSPFKQPFSRRIWVSRYQNVSILDFIGAKNDAGGGDDWSYKTCKAPVKSSPTNQHPVFYRPDVLPVTQPTVSEHAVHTISLVNNTHVSQSSPTHTGNSCKLRHMTDASIQQCSEHWIGEVVHTTPSQSPASSNQGCWTSCHGRLAPAWLLNGIIHRLKSGPLVSYIYPAQWRWQFHATGMYVIVLWAMCAGVWSFCTVYL